MSTDLVLSSPPSALAAPLQLDGVSVDRLRDAFFGSKGTETQRAYRATLADFTGYLSKRSDRSLGETEAISELLRAGPGPGTLLVLEWRAHLAGRMSPGSVNRHLACLRSLVEFGKTIGQAVWTLKVPNLKTAGPYKDTRGPGRGPVRSMLDELAAREDAQGRRDYAVLRLLYDLGLRRFEVAGLDLEHIDLAAARAQVLRKGKPERLPLTLPRPTIAALRRWLEVRGSAPGPLFTGFHGGKGKRLEGGGVYRAVRRMGRAVGVTTRPHQIRHTSITEAVKRAQKAGIGIDEVRQFSGHADIRTLLIYRDADRDVQGKIATLVAEDA